MKILAFALFLLVLAVLVGGVLLVLPLLGGECDYSVMYRNKDRTEWPLFGWKNRMR